MENLTMFDIDENLTKLLDDRDAALESGHGMMQDAFEKDIEDLVAERAEKVDRCIGYVKHCEAMVKAVDEEIARLNRVSDKYQKRADYLKSVAGFIMAKHGDVELKGTCDRRFVTQKGTYVQILNTDLIPKEFMREIPASVEPDKRAIDFELKAGRIVPGAGLGVRSYVSIK